MEENKIRIAILGAGISGLATAFWLSKNKNYEVTVFEENSEAGGAMTTENMNDFIIDFGPNSGLETTPLIREIVEEIGLGDEMIYASNVADKRYILRHNKLHALPTGPKDFFKSTLFTVKGKLRLFAEPFIPRYMDDKPESIYQFVVRRLGREFADYAIDPFVSGVYAGDPHKLCVRSAFPKVKALEENYGGLIKGMILGAKERKKRKEQSKNYARMFSFKNGMQSFPQAISDHLRGKVKYNHKVDNITRSETGYRVIGYNKERELFNPEFDIVISTLPAYTTSAVMEEIDNSLKENLESLFYPRVKVLFVVFKKEQIKQPLDGFGFLIPSEEKKKFLGAIWSSTIFPNRAPKDYAAFTLFIGGARTNLDDSTSTIERQKIVLKEFKEIMGVEGPFVFIKEMDWPRAIPQYNIGYTEHEKAFNYFEQINKGLLLAGNYRGGISVGDCVKYSETITERVNDLVKNNYVPRINKIKHKDLTNWKDGILWDNTPQKD